MNPDPLSQNQCRVEGQPSCREMYSQNSALQARSEQGWGDKSLCVRCPLPWPLWMGAANLRSPSFYFLSSHPPPNLPPLKNQNKKTDPAEQCGQAATKASPSLCPHPSSRPLAVWRGQRWSPGVGTMFRGSREPETEHSYWGRCARSTAGTICPKRLGLVTCRANSGHHPEIQAARSPHQRPGALGGLWCLHTQP